MLDKKVIYYQIIIVLSAALFFIPFLGGAHLFDWDEINFAESAREMIESGDYLSVQINFIPFWEKPPLFIWMQVLSMKIFGMNEFAARFPNALCGIITLLVLFNIGRKLKDLRFGLLWVLLYAGSVLPFLYFKSGIIDPWFNLFIFLGIYHIYRYFDSSHKHLTHALLSAFSIGLAVLTKGPVALLVFMITTGLFLLIRKFRVHIRMKDVLLFTLILTFTGGFWFILQILQGNFSVIADFITYQIRLFKTKDAGHGGFLLYHFAVLFFGVFPASIFALPALFRFRQKTGEEPGMLMWMQLLFWVVLLLFTVVKTKIVHYSSLCYFPLTFIASWSVYHARSYTKAWRKATPILILIIGFLMSFLSIGLTFIDRFKDQIVRNQWINDPFAVACLNAEAGWHGFEFIAGLLLLAGLTWFAMAWKKELYKRAVWIITGSVLAFTLSAMTMIVPRVEAYSQRAAIDFFKSVSKDDVYLETLGYKSYAHLFYGKIKNHPNDMAHDELWILKGPIDKTAYFAVKITKKDFFMKDNPELQLLYEKNGFVFFVREPLKERIKQ